MHVHRTRTQPRRLLAATAAGIFALAGTAAVAPSAEAAPAPRTYTTVMTPTSATPGVSTSYSVVVKNTSPVISALDHVVLVVPNGFSVVPGTVTAPRGGWSTSLNTAGTELTARTSQPLRYALRKGETLTMTFSATDQNACDTSTVTWGQKADGLIIDPFVAQSPDPEVQMNPVADRFVITSVTDVNPLAPGYQVVKGDPITVSGDFRCGSTLLAPTAGPGTLSLTRSAPGVPANSGVLDGTLGASVAKGATGATISGATYSAVANAVGVTVGWDGGTGDVFAMDVLGAAASVNATPNVGIDPAALTVVDAVAGLPKGASGAVAITIQACTDQLTVPCSGGTEVSLAGDFKNGSTPLYSNEAPASITRVCATECPHQPPGGTGPEAEGSSTYTYNYLCPGSSCSGHGSLFGEREVEEDFTWYPTYVSLRNDDGTYEPFELAPRCVPLPGKYDSSSKRTALLKKTGQIVDPIAKAKRFCVDVNAISRDGNVFSGTLRIPVLFVEDPRVRP